MMLTPLPRRDPVLPATFGNVDVTQLRRGYAYVNLVDRDVLNHAFTALRAYFAQPLAVKQKDGLAQPGEQGYRDLVGVKELYMVRRPVVAPLLQPVLPIWRRADALVRQTLTQVAQQLDMDQVHFANLLDDPPLLGCASSASVLRLLHYRAQPHWAAVEHEDLGLLSFVPPSTCSALQVLDMREFAFHDVERLAEGQAILMVGRTLELLTGGAFQSCVHRVRGTAVPRYSMVYQARPRADAVIDSAHFAMPGQPSLRTAETVLWGFRH